MILLEILSLHFCICYVWGLSGFIEEMKYIIFKKEDVSVKPFDCDVCINMWVILGFSIYSGLGLILSMFLGCLFSYLSSSTINAMVKFRDYLESI